MTCKKCGIVLHLSCNYSIVKINCNWLCDFCSYISNNNLEFSEDEKPIVCIYLIKSKVF